MNQDIKESKETECIYDDTAMRQGALCRLVHNRLGGRSKILLSLFKVSPSFDLIILPEHLQAVQLC